MLHATDVDEQMVITAHSPAMITGIQRKDVFIMHDGRCKDEIMEEHMLVPMRAAKYSNLVQGFRETVILGKKRFG